VLVFVSKYLFVTGLAALLRAAERFTFARANAQQRRANELLGILATDETPDLAYVTWGPTRLARSSLVCDVGTLFGQRPDAAVRPIIDMVDAPTPGRPAYRGAKKLTLTGCDRDDENIASLAAAVTRWTTTQNTSGRSAGRTRAMRQRSTPGPAWRPPVPRPRSC
jgi:hypothetical protein